MKNPGKIKNTAKPKLIIKLLTLIEKYVFILFFLGIILEGCTDTSNHSLATIYIKPDADKLEILAAREVRKFIYQRTGKLFPITEWGKNKDINDSAIIVGNLAKQIQLKEYDLPKLSHEAYILKTLSSSNSKKLLIYGGSSLGTLYAAYKFAEQSGIGFYLDGDIIPDQQIPFSIPKLNIKRKPLFSIRGILPFHDFPEGPDWWSADDYKAIIAQLPKLGMNFIGFHTYPEGKVGPEPMVWIGPPWAIGKNGNVKSSYASRHFTTLEGCCHYEPMRTSDYSFGASQMYEQDLFGAKYMMEAGPSKLQSFKQQNRLFDRFGKLLDSAFTFAKELGIKTCIGTQTPLKIPEAVKIRLNSFGKDPSDSKVVQKIYEGMFKRIEATHPLDYYWLWTPEFWTWRGVKPSQVDKTLSDFKSAIAAAEVVKAPFTLATSGWVLGPPQNRSLFDQYLPKKMPMSTINRHVGWSPVEPGFAKVEGRPKWAIPWLEDDLGLTIPQLWAGRMRRDAADALAYGSTGLIGIHWRTRIIGPNVSALAHAAWDQEGWNKNFPHPNNPFINSKPNFQAYKSGKKGRDLPTKDFYIRWAKIHFGSTASKEIGVLFSQLDGTKGYDPSNRRTSHLPRPATWVGGPGGILPDKRPWNEVRKEYLFVDTLENFRSKIKGSGNLERFDYWVNQFQYLRGVGHLNCVWYQFNQIMEKIRNNNDPGSQRKIAQKQALPLRIKMVDILTKLQNHLMESITTYGGLGNVANWQQQIIPRLMRLPGLELEKYLGEKLPEAATLPKNYTGSPHIFVPTVRTVLNKGESLNLKVITISPENTKPVREMIYWKTLGQKNFSSEKLNHLARGVYTFTIDSTEISPKGLEYYIEIEFNNGYIKRFPASAPDINQVVTIVPK